MPRTAGVLMAAAGAALALAARASAASPDVVISEVYGGGGNNGATYTNDFVELSNEGGELVTLMDTLPLAERYSYVYEGNSEVLDQILVSEPLLQGKPDYDSVHVNAEFADQASDHDPQVARLRVLGPAAP